MESDTPTFARHTSAQRVLDRTDAAQWLDSRVPGGLASPLARLLGWPQKNHPQYGVLMQSAESSFILAIDNFAGREDAVIKSLDDFRPKGVAGVTTLSNGQIVLILDMKELLDGAGERRGVSRAALLAAAE